MVGVMHWALTLRPAQPAARTVAALASQVERARSAHWDFVYLADEDGVRPLTVPPAQSVQFEPTLLCAALASLVRNIGFVATAATRQHELYNLARRFASLDLISGGRAGWRAVATGPSTEWDTEYVDVVRALWGSWDADAFVYDKAAGQFFVPEKMHVLAHRGAHFTVRGPLNVNPSPQGRPLLAQTLTAAREAISPFTELILVAAATEDECRAALRECARQLLAQRRVRSDVRVLVAVMPWIGRGTRPPDSGRGLNLEGTAADIADALGRIRDEQEIDGFLISPAPVPDGLDGVFGALAPELARRGYVRAGYPTTTLRGHLGLPS